MMKRLIQLLTAGLISWAGCGVAAPPARPISVEDTFRLGSGSGILCSAQVNGSDPALSDMFDRGYAIVCRDAAAPVGRLYVLRERGGDPSIRLDGIRAGKAECAAPRPETIEDLGTVQLSSCTMKGSNVGYRVYRWREKNRLYVAEGLAGYDSALRLGLRTLVADRPVKGEIAIAVTEAGDPVSFARVQAGTLDPGRALAEAYRRNNSGSYAEAAEFFSALLENSAAGISTAEALVNQALQQSNLGNLAEADILFARAERLAGTDAITARMLRNYRAMHFMNRQQPTAALAELEHVLPAVEGSRPGNAFEIDAEKAARLNASAQLAVQASELLPQERAEILDAQAQQLRGTIFRLQDKPRAQAAAALNEALARLAAVRDGRVVSTRWMRAQVLGELAALAEAAGDRAEAESRHLEAVALLKVNHPGSAAFLNAQARLAGYYSRTGKADAARSLYREIVEASATAGNSSPNLRRMLSPYFSLLASGQSDPAAVADMFTASQLLVRPGVAQTQAVLARELSGGSDEAARLFRQSVNLTRDIERTRVELSRLQALAEPTADDAARIAALRAQLEQTEQDQVVTQAKLADFPRYRVVSGGAMTLGDLQKALLAGEAYYKMITVGNDSYALFVTPGGARMFRIGATADELERQVDAIRDSITKVEDGQILTFPFDVVLANKLYGELFAPVEAELAGTRHLIFEPDGAMLRLPPNLLVTERKGVDAYLARASRPTDDGFDFTGIRWLGRDRDVSTAVSARAFRDVRRVAPSKASANYIGFGQNALPEGTVRAASAVRGLLDESSSCSWSINEWARPIAPDELYIAGNALGKQDAQIVTGAAFSDTAIKKRGDLSKYRIMHFATHGLVTAPRPDCPARPALLTSFGEADSDGLLTFAEIFDLKIDADLVILSACDTAGKASVAATREAGVPTGGDFALDGLVRAFVGAGGRSVIASHWPVPDDYDATKTLISGLFTAAPGTSTATALRQAQIGLMDRPETSHPYYWSGFAIIGDGAAAVMAKN